jgi:hypothetical protein
MPMPVRTGSARRRSHGQRMMRPARRSAQLRPAGQDRLRPQSEPSAGRKQLASGRVHASAMVARVRPSPGLARPCRSSRNEPGRHQWRLVIPIAERGRPRAVCGRPNPFGICCDICQWMCPSFTNDTSSSSGTAETKPCGFLASSSFLARTPLCARRATG